MTKILTVKAIERFKPDPDKRKHIPDGTLPGFYLIIQRSGKKSWAVWYRIAGKQHKYTIGAYPAFGLSDARKAAAAVLRQVSEGRDPSAIRKQMRAGAQRDLVATIVENFLARHICPKSRPSYAEAVERMLRKDVLPVWGKRRISDITKRDVIELLDGITDAGRGLAVNRVFSVIRKMFNWALERDIIDVSPCHGIKPPAKETTRDRVLSDDDLRHLIIATDALGYPFGGLVKLLVLTGQRRNEVAGMTYEEISDGVWTIPAERTKNGRVHQVPLSDLAQRTINALPKVRTDHGVPPYLFTTTGKTPVSGYSRAKGRLAAIMLTQTGKDVAEMPRWTLHDLRRTVASGMARLTIALPVIEKVLNHASGSFGGIAGVYQRHDYADEKRHALETWARHVENLTEGVPDNVVTFGERETS